jgi:ankyrin repeat protein
MFTQDFLRFLPAKLYMDFLASKAVTSRKSHVLQALRSLPSFHDKTFEEAYRDAYTGILKGIWEQSAYDVELARKVLSWVVFTKDPQNLTIDVVKHALFLEDEIDEAGTDIDVTDDEYDEIPEEKLLSVCRGLLTVDHHGRTLRFVHYTAEIYFSKPAVQNVDFPSAQEQITQACLSCILSNTLRGAGCYQLYRYASLHWGHHAQTVEELVQHEIQRLFEDERKMRHSFQRVVAPDWSKGLAVNSGIKPLHVAAYFGLRLIATTLLEKTEDIEAKDFRGWDPMRWAIFGESDALVALLFDHKANLLSQDYDGLNTMFWAVSSRETKQIVSNIVLNGDARLSLGEISTVRSGQSFATALPSPVLPNTSQSVIKFLLSNLPEVDLDIRSPVDGQTLLSVVAGNWQWDAVKILLGRGANVNLKDNNGMTPLLWSLQCPRSRTVIKNVVVSDNSWLSIGGIMNVESSAKISIDDSNYSEEKVEPNICLLIGDELEAKDDTERTALSLCAENRFHKVAAMLLEMGANPNTADVEGMTPLHWACSLPRLQSVVVKNLVCKDYARVRLGTSKLPRLPLAEPRRLSVHNINRTVKSLLRYEADVFATNSLGQTALALAISDGLDSHAKILLEYQPSACDSKVEDSSNRHVYGRALASEPSQREDCERLLVALLDRRGQFKLLNVVTMDNSSLFIYSTSNITNLSAGDTSRVLITDKPNITTLTAFHASRVVIRAAANITSIAVNTHSRVYIDTNANINRLMLTDSCAVNVQGQAAIASVSSHDHARLTVGSEAKIEKIRVVNASSLYTKDQCAISRIMTSDHANVKIGADTKIGEMLMDRYSRVHAKGRCAISKTMISDSAHIKIEADTKIEEMRIDCYSQVHAKGQATIMKILGSGHSTLNLQAGAKIGDIETREHSIVRMAGHSQVSRMSGFDWSRIFLLAQAHIEDIGTNGHCLVLTKGRSEIHRVTSCDFSVLAVLESYQNQPLEVVARDDARLLFCEEDGRWSEGNFWTLDHAKLTIQKFNPASTSEIINSLKEALGLDEEQLNIPEEVAQESEDEISDNELDDLGDDKSSDEDWSWAADIGNVDIK